MNILTILSLTKLLCLVIVAVLFTPFQTRRGMFIFLV